jgi:6-phosphogluconolactonase
MKREIYYVPTLQELGNQAASLVAATAQRCVDEKNVFNLALSGGETPRMLYSLLSRPPFSTLMPWGHTQVFWGDERCVPPTDPDSNYRMAMEAMIPRVPVPLMNVYRIPAEMEPPEDAAAEYAWTIAEALKTRGLYDIPAGAPFPSLDLIVLGVGTDGHTASLFPGDRVLEETYLWVSAVFAPDSPPEVPRITLTLPVINAARGVLFLVSGDGKGEVVRAILEKPESAVGHYPAAMVSPVETLIWLVDKTVIS